MGVIAPAMPGHRYSHATTLVATLTPLCLTAPAVPATCLLPPLFCWRLLPTGGLGRYAGGLPAPVLVLTGWAATSVPIEDVPGVTVGRVVVSCGAGRRPAAMVRTLGRIKTLLLLLLALLPAGCGLPPLPLRAGRVLLLRAGRVLLPPLLPAGKGLPPLLLPAGRDLPPVLLPAGSDLLALLLPAGRDLLTPLLSTTRPLLMPAGEGLLPLLLPAGSFLPLLCGGCFFPPPPPLLLLPLLLPGAAAAAAWGCCCCSSKGLRGLVLPGPAPATASKSIPPAPSLTPPFVPASISALTPTISDALSPTASAASGLEVPSSSCHCSLLTRPGCCPSWIVGSAFGCSSLVGLWWPDARGPAGCSVTCRPPCCVGQGTASGTASPVAALQ